MEEEELISGIEDDLMALIQDEGLTATRVEAYGTNIIKAFGVKSAEFVLTEVLTAFLDVPDDKYKKALSYALGVDSPQEVSRLTARRELLMEEDGFAVSEDTLRRWERRAMKGLARGILARAAQGKDVQALRYRMYADKHGSVEEKIEAMKLDFDNKINRWALRFVRLESEYESTKADVAKLQKKLAKLEGSS